MRVEYIFYTVGAIFAIAAVIYFTWEYLFELGRPLKIFALALLTIAFYTFANYLRRRDI